MVTLRQPLRRQCDLKDLTSSLLLVQADVMALFRGELLHGSSIFKLVECLLFRRQLTAIRRQCCHCSFTTFQPRLFAPQQHFPKQFTHGKSEHIDYHNIHILFAV